MEGELGGRRESGSMGGYYNMRHKATKLMGLKQKSKVIYFLIGATGAAAVWLVKGF